MPLNNKFDIRKPILDSLIEECDVGEFKLTDGAFVQACNEYHMEEDAVMELMVNCAPGEFVRIEEGWIFLTP
jgi:hypothetical protein